jgi:putative membrane protein
MINILKGILISISLLVPGVSGGTMMIVLGVYDQSIEALSALISRKLLHIKLLIQLAIGGVIGLALFSKAMLWSLETYPFVMSFLFLGIVIAGLNAIIKKVDWKKFQIYHILFLVVGIVIALVMTQGQSGELINFSGSFIQRLLIILIAGIIIAVALILPGISTSFLLLTLGMYEETLAAINTLDVGFLLPLGIGVLFGVLLTTKLLEYLMKNHPTPTYLMILGFILGSLGEIFPGIPTDTLTKFNSVVAFIIGAIIMIIIQIIMKKYPNYED